MKHRILSIILVVILLFSLPLSVSASESLPMVIDNAGLLDNSEETALETKAQELRNKYEMDIVILTVNSLEGKSAQAYADDYYDNNGYGYGEDDNGLLFLLAMEEREWYISTYGEAVYSFTDYGIQTLGESVFSYLQEDNYATVFNAYLAFLPEYFHDYDTGAAVDGYAAYSGDYYHGEQDTVVYYENDHAPNFPLSLVIGVITAAVAILIMRSSMNTRRMQRSASGYLRAGSFHLKRHQDLFLYSNVSKVRRQQNNSNGGGGSSVHRSSSGRRHGGGGGRF